MLASGLAAGLAVGPSAAVTAAPPAIPSQEEAWRASTKEEARTAGTKDLATMLLTEKDLPAQYARVEQDPFASVRDDLFGRTGKACTLPIDVRRSVHAVFRTEVRNTLDLESLVEVITEPGADAARALVERARALPGKCAKVETPRHTIFVRPAVMDRIGDSSAALRVTVWVKAASSPTNYVDVVEAELAVAAKRNRAVTVVLLGFYPTHAATPARVLRTAVARLR